MKLLYEFDDKGVFLSDRQIEKLDEILVKTEIVDGKEKPLVKLVLPRGLTDEPIPADFKVYPGISPKFIDGEWIEDVEAVKTHLESLPKAKQLMSHEQMDELLTYLAGGKL
jgi:hypothetical protein